MAPTSSRGVLVLAWLAQGLIVSAGPSGRSCALYTLHTKGDEGKQRETQGDEGGQRETKGDRGRRMETESQPHPAAPRAKGPPPKHQGPARRHEHLAPSKVAQNPLEDSCFTITGRRTRLCHTKNGHGPGVDLSLLVGRAGARRVGKKARLRSIRVRLPRAEAGGRLPQVWPRRFCAKPPGPR